MNDAVADGQIFLVVDLDGTLSDSAHRDHLAVAKEWDEFHSKLVEDEPHWDVADLLSVISDSFHPVCTNLQIVALTGRNERYRIATEQWMLKHSIKVDHLLMRPDHNWASDHDLKPQMLVDFVLGEGEGTFDLRAKEAARKVWFILEDRDKVVEAWRNLGFRCWQTQMGGY